METIDLATVDKSEVVDLLRRRFGIESQLIQLPVLAKIVGVKKATLYLHAREGMLFVPCRYINRTPLVDLDDLAAWYVQSGCSALNKANKR